MRLYHWIAAGFALAMVAGCVPPPEQAAAPGAPPPAQAAPAGPLYTITYFDVAPGAERSTEALLRSFTAATRSAPGNVEFLALHEIARPNRFALVEAWADKAAHDAHSTAMAALADKLQPTLATPLDFRQFVPLSVAGPGVVRGPRVVYVLTHVDVFPTYKDQVAAMVRQQVDDSRHDRGALRYDALVWDGHPNHFHLIEAWANRADQQAHALAAHTLQFRAKVAPFEGALYDERLYEAVR